MHNVCPLASQRLRGDKPHGELMETFTNWQVEDEKADLQAKVAKKREEVAVAKANLVFSPTFSEDIPSYPRPVSPREGGDPSPAASGS